MPSINTEPLRRLEKWIGKLDIDQAKKVHQGWCAADWSALEAHQERVKVTQPADAPLIRSWRRKVSGAVEHAASQDPRTGWKPEWPAVSAAAEMAVFGIFATTQSSCAVLIEPIEAGGFRV